MGPVEITPTKTTKSQQQPKKQKCIMHKQSWQNTKDLFITFILQCLWLDLGFLSIPLQISSLQITLIGKHYLMR